MLISLSRQQGRTRTMFAPPLLYYILSVSVPYAVGFNLLAQPSRVRLPRIDSFERRLSSTKNDEDIPAVYPLSRRKAMLIEEAKKLDPSIASGGNIGERNREIPFVCHDIFENI